MAQGDREDLSCTDGCGAKTHDTSSAQAEGWLCLQITGRYRCPACQQELARVNQHYRETDQP